MGGGTKRKSNDTVRINRPQKTDIGGGGSGVGGGNSQRDINKVCPPSFDVRIKPSRSLPDGTPVDIKNEELFVINERVGKLSPEHIRIITECGSEGIHYVGRIFNSDKNKTYARFEQKSRG